MSTPPSEPSMDRLPPISAMDSFIASRLYPQPTTSYPPSTKPGFYEQRPSMSAVHGHSYPQPPPQPPAHLHQRQHSLPGVALSSSSSSSSSTITTPTPSAAPFPAADRSIDMDIDEVVRHCTILSDQMRLHQASLVDDTHDPTRVRTWLDDLVARANEVLNALLRLRKHQIAAEYTRHHGGIDSHQQSQSSHSQPPQQQPTARRSTRYNDYQHSQETLSLSTIRQRKRGKRAVFQGRCHSCNISETPEWRRGPDGARTLCNACGLHYAKLARKKAQQEQPQDKVSYDVLVPDLSVRKSNPLLSPSTTDEPMDEVESLAS